MGSYEPVNSIIATINTVCILIIILVLVFLFIEYRRIKRTEEVIIEFINGTKPK